MESGSSQIICTFKEKANNNYKAEFSLLSEFSVLSNISLS